MPFTQTPFHSLLFCKSSIKWEKRKLIFWQLFVTKKLFSIYYPFPLWYFIFFSWRNKNIPRLSYWILRKPLYSFPGIFIFLGISNSLWSLHKKLAPFSPLSIWLLFLVLGSRWLSFAVFSLRTKCMSSWASLVQFHWGHRKSFASIIINIYVSWPHTQVSLDKFG